MLVELSLDHLFNFFATVWTKPHSQFMLIWIATREHKEFFCARQESLIFVLNFPLAFKHLFEPRFQSPISENTLGKIESLVASNLSALVA